MESSKKRLKTLSVHLSKGLKINDEHVSQKAIYHSIFAVSTSVSITITVVYLLKTILSEAPNKGMVNMCKK